MFKLNLKIALRNLRKNIGYSVVNILGLALGLSGFIFMILFMNYERSYDTWHPDLQNVYQVQEYSDYYTTDNQNHWSEFVDIRYGKVFLEQIPQTKAVTAVSRVSRDHGIKLEDKPAFFQDGLIRSDSLFFKVFPYEFKYGNAETALLNPKSIVLKESIALKYFGESDPIGKVINIAAGSYQNKENLYTVTGVIKELNTPSSLDFNGVMFLFGDFLNIRGDEETAAELYVRTIPEINLDQINKSVQKAYLPLKNTFTQGKRKLDNYASVNNLSTLKITQLKEVHQQPIKGKSWRDTVKPVILLSVLLVLVSVINFINLATAQASERAKEVGVKKVVGAHKRSLVSQFMTETFIQCICAMLLALLIVEITMPSLNSYFNLSLSLMQGPDKFMLFIQLMGVVMIISLLTGLYPSLFLSSYKPIQVLKGNFSNSKSGLSVKKALVGLQFVISISFIIGILTINYQLSFLKTRDNGFTPEGLLNVRASTVRTSNQELLNELKRVDGVKHVSYASGIMGDNSSRLYDYKYNGEIKQLYTIGVSIDGLEALNVRLMEGRLFSEKIASDTIDNVLINESAAKLFNYKAVGKTLISAENVPVKVIGVIKDIQIEGFDEAVKPTMYGVVVNEYKGAMSYTIKPSTLIRYDITKTETVIAGLEAVFNKHNSLYPMSFTFLEEDFKNVLIEQERFERMVAVFSTVSLCLSLFGIFALATFTIRQRTREIAIRKVLGADFMTIVILLNKGYIWIVLIANLIAFPFAYILINKWLSTFAYRIEINYIPFLLAFVVSMVITLITVSLQSRKAVKANPVKALKYE